MIPPYPTCIAKTVFMTAIFHTRRHGPLGLTGAIGLCLYWRSTKHGELIAGLVERLISGAPSMDPVIWFCLKVRCPIHWLNLLDRVFPHPNGLIVVSTIFWHNHIYIYMYVCMYEWMYECMYVSMYLCIYVYMYICIYVYVYICIYAYMYICIHVYVYMYICIYVYMYICIYLYMYICIYVYMYMYICIYVYMYICIYVNM